MISSGADKRSSGRKVRDEQIAAEPPLSPPDLPADAAASSMEGRLPRLRARALQNADNGLVGPVDPAVELP
jgi:hypothetical protein